MTAIEAGWAVEVGEDGYDADRTMDRESREPAKLRITKERERQKKKDDGHLLRAKLDTEKSMKRPIVDEREGGRGERVARPATAVLGQQSVK